MVSNKIALSPEGEGMSLALQEAERVAEEAGLSHDNVLVLRLITEEMLAMLRSVTHNLKAEYWLVWDGTDFELHLSAKQNLSYSQRRTLVNATTSGKNEAVQTFLDKLRGVFEAALALDKDVTNYYTATGYDTSADITDDIIKAEKPDGFERSLLLTLADVVRIAIKGGIVDMTVEKKF